MPASNTSINNVRVAGSSCYPSEISISSQDARADKIIEDPVHKNKEMEEIQRVGLRDRVRHFTWAWFTSTMSTGGLAILLGVTPHRFRGLYTIGVILFTFNLALFLVLCTAMTTRLIIDPPRFKASFVHPPESFFFGSFLLSVAVILAGIQIYGVTLGPAPLWLITTIRILYWIYASISLLNVIAQYYIYIRRTPHRPLPMNPAWFFPGYSAMLTGTIAGLIAESQPPEHRIPIIVSGLAYKGFGWLISFALIVMFMVRLMEAGLPPPGMRPGMFIPIGTPGYTIVALIRLARSIPPEYGYFALHPQAKETCQTLALFVSVFLWILSFWVLCLAVLACVECIGKMPFTLTWWAFVFPNVGFSLATILIGEEFESEGILWVGSVMTVLVLGIWCVSASGCVRAVLLRKIMWPGKDEDRDMDKKT